MSADKLSPKHRRFVDEFLIDLNGTQAAIRAGYSKDRAKFTASDLLARPDVKAAVAEKQGQRSAEAGDRATRAAARLEAIALMDLDPLAEAPAGLVQASRAACVDLLKLDGKFVDRVENEVRVTVIRAPAVADSTAAWHKQHAPQAKTSP